jgi:putative ABC transport system permease protein
MAIPLKYNFHNLRVRWRSTLATMLGIALVVAVFILVLAMDRGMSATYVNTGDERNLIILRKGATAESSSQISRNEARRIRYLEGIARNDNGEPLVSSEIIVLISLERIASKGTANVLVRGISPIGIELRPQLKITEGRMFQPGLNECIVSARIAQRFKNCRVGESFVSGATTWRVVGIFDAAKTAYESEIWVDADEARAAFKRDFYGSMLLRASDPRVPQLLSEREKLRAKEKEAAEGKPTRSFLGRSRTTEFTEADKARLAQIQKALAATLVGRIDADNQLNVKISREVDYYKEQTKSGGLFAFLGSFLAIIMSIGAAFAAMNTMYAAVGARTREIGTLRVLGFHRWQIYASFLTESVILSVAGGALGCLCSLLLNGRATGTLSQTTFAEVAYEFRITNELIMMGMTFAIVMGVLGGLLPAWTAAKKSVLDALRSV